MRVSEVMTRNVYSVREWEELGLSQDLMRFRRFGHLPVVDAHGHVVGMISRMDLVERATRPGNPRLVPVYDVMTRPAVTVPADCPIEEAAREMTSHRIHALPVVDDDGKLAGIVSDSDLLAVLAGRRVPVRDIGSTPVSRLMTPAPVTIGVDEELGEAATAMLERGFRHLPVLDGDGELVGMISERDLRSRIGTDFVDWSTVEGSRLSEPVGNVMVPDPVIVRQDNALSEVLDIFADEQIGALPVLDADDRLVGILSYVDVLAWLRDASRSAATGVDTEAPGAGP